MKFVHIFMPVIFLLSHLEPSYSCSSTANNGNNPFPFPTTETTTDATTTDATTAGATTAGATTTGASATEGTTTAGTVTTATSNPQGTGLYLLKAHVRLIT